MINGMKMTGWAIAAVVAVLGSAYGNTEKKNPPLIPMPQQVVWGEGAFPLDQATIFVEDQANADNARILREVLGVPSLKISQGSGQGIHLKLVSELPEVRPVGIEESYRLKVGSNGILLEAVTPAGIARGVQTLRQLTYFSPRKGTVPCCDILDWPAFKIRGQMHDIGRNYIPFERLMREMDIMAFYKLNTFHWHLTDNEGWRLEIKSHPELTAPKAQSRFNDKFYTQDQVRELVEYCRQRHINVIPEIDMPGHSRAFKRGTGFDMQSPEGVEILKDVLKEVVELFPSRYIHIGADETGVGNKEFMPTMLGLLKSYDRDIVMWRPGNPVADERVVEQLWNARYPAPKAGKRTIDSCLYYTDATMEHLSCPVVIFNASILNVDEGSDELLGAIVCHWVESSNGKEGDIFLQSPIYTAIVAMAERSWLGKGYDMDEAVLPPKHSHRYDAFCEYEDRFVTHRDTFLKDLPVFYIKQTDIEWRILGPFDNGGNFSREFLETDDVPRRFTSPDGDGYRSQVVGGGTVYLGPMYQFQNFGLYHGKQKNKTAYAHTWVFSEKEQDKHMWIDFKHVPRSGGLRLPKKDTWDDCESKIWLNGEEIAPPDWTKKDRRGWAYSLGTISCREPSKIHLKEGWNKFFVKTSSDGGSGWHFTAAIIDWDGERASEPTGIRYSANGPERTSRSLVDIIKAGTNIETLEGFGVDQLLDGDSRTYFSSKGGPATDAVITFTLDKARPFKSLSISTGRLNGTDRLLEGLVEYSTNGSSFVKLADFVDGHINAEFPEGGVKAFRLRVSKKQRNRLIIRDVVMK